MGHSAETSLLLENEPDDAQQIEMSAIFAQMGNGERLEKGALVKTVAKLDLCKHIKTPAYAELRSSWNWIIRRI